jgi:hypothetical protein
MPESSLPFAQALAKGAWTQAIELEEGKPGLRLALAPNAENRVVVVDLRVDRWLRLLARENLPAGTVAFLVDSDGKSIVSSASVSSDWSTRSWLTATQPVGPGGALSAVSQTEPELALGAIQKFAEKAALLGLLGIALAIFLSSWLLQGPHEGEPIVELRSDLGEEFAHLLNSIRQRIDQIHDEPSIDVCHEKLESLSHQAAWAEKIFDKMRHIQRAGS